MKHREQLVWYWSEKSRESLASAESELNAGRLTFAINRLYYCMFYAISALYAAKGEIYTKHSAIRAAFHRDYIKSELLDKRIGRLYDELFNARQQGDYVPMTEFEEEVIAEHISEVKGILPKISKLVHVL